MTTHSTAPLVVITRAEEPEGPLARALSTAGLRGWAFPAITIAPQDDPRDLDRALSRLESYDWLVFTSGHAVAAVCGRPAWAHRGCEGFSPRVAAVGRATALRLAGAGVRPTLVPEKYGAEPLADELIARGNVSGSRVLWPCSDIAGSVLRERLEAAGAHVDAPVAYRTVPAKPEDVAEMVRALGAGEIAAVAFLSPSSAKGLVRALGAADLRQVAGVCVIASVGPTTSAALRALGAPPTIEATDHSVTGLAAALRAHLLPARKES